MSAGEGLLSTSLAPPRPPLAYLIVRLYYLGNAQAAPRGRWVVHIEEN